MSLDTNWEGGTSERKEGLFMRCGNIYLSINNVLEEVLATINFDHHGWSSQLRGQCRLLVRLLRSEMEYFGKCPFIDARALAEEHLEDIVYEEIVRGYTKWQAGGHSGKLGASCGISVAIDRACTIYAD